MIAFIMADVEIFPLVDELGRVIGRAERSEVHKNPKLMHPVVHCLVENQARQLLLQLRSAQKDVQPGRWDTSVGGHVHFGEPVHEALIREIREEIGIEVAPAQLTPMGRYVMRSPIETELVHSFWLRYEGPFSADPSEIDQLGFWSRADIERQLGTGVLTPNFEDEYARYLDFFRRSVGPG